MKKVYELYAELCSMENISAQDQGPVQLRGLNTPSS